PSRRVDIRHGFDDFDLRHRVSLGPTQHGRQLERKEAGFTKCNYRGLRERPYGLGFVGTGGQDVSDGVDGMKKRLSFLRTFGWKLLLHISSPSSVCCRCPELRYLELRTTV